MTLDRALAFVAALLFAVHPVHAEAVDWISAVTELELTVFFLATFWFFLRAAGPQGKCSGPAKLGMLGCYILALLSKEQALTLPLLATVYEHFYRDDRRETRWVQKLSRYRVLWLCGLAYVLFRMHFLGGFAPSLQRPRLGWSEAVLGAIALIAQYLWKLLWPAHLVAYYGFPDDISVLIPWMVGGFGALILSAALFITLWRRNRLASFGLVWLLVTLAPVLNARWMASNVFNERYLYLPSVGFCWLVAWAWKDLWEMARNRDTLWRRLLLASAGLLLALCALRIITRNRDWHDDVRLYTRTLEVVPNSDRVRSALGLAYWELGNTEAAEREWQLLLAHDPNNTATWNYLGVVRAQRKDYAEAVSCFERSLRLDPSSADKHLNLGAAYAEQGLMELAEMQFRAAAALSPLNTQAHNVLGKLYFDAGRLREAEEEFRRSLVIEPNVPAYDHLGYIYLKWNRSDLAETAFRGALSINPAEDRAHFNLGAIYAADGKYSEAVQEYRAALRADPQDVAAREALQELGRHIPAAQSTRP
jgi:tetratricopeptide (TPR) repeat protein